MEKDFPRNYDADVVDVLQALSLTGDGRNIKVIGSASLRSIQYAGDYDANEISRESRETIAKQLRQVIKRLKKIPLLVIGDIKCGEEHGVPIRWTPDEMAAGKKPGITLREALNLTGKTKIDTMAVVAGGRYVEIGCVYLFGDDVKPPDDDVLVQQLTEAMAEEERDGNYWKALKRLFSIARLTDDKVRIDRLTPIFNSDLGRLYSVVSDVDILIKLLQDKKGNKAIIKQEVDGFRGRLSNIWRLPEFIKAEPGFDRSIERAVDEPQKMLPILSWLHARLYALLQSEARGILRKETKGKKPGKTARK